MLLLLHVPTKKIYIFLTVCDADIDTIKLRLLSSRGILAQRVR